MEATIKLSQLIHALSKQGYLIGLNNQKIIICREMDKMPYSKEYDVINGDYVTPLVTELRGLGRHYP